MNYTDPKKTVDGHPYEPGMRVWSAYANEAGWGTVTYRGMPRTGTWDGWAYVEFDNGEVHLLDGTRCFAKHN